MLLAGNLERPSQRVIISHRWYNAMLKSAFVLIQRDLRLALRHGMDSLMAVVFFVLAVVLFPFGVGSRAGHADANCPGSSSGWRRCWRPCSRSNACFRPITRTEAWNCWPWPRCRWKSVVVAKVDRALGDHGVAVDRRRAASGCFPQYGGTDGFVALIGALALGTPLLSLVGAVGAALILGSRRGGVLC